MSTTARIGKSIHIKGTLTAEEPLVVAGHVEGSITVTGHPLSITQEGNVDADAVADTIVIDGAAKGRLHANTRMTLRETAKVVGEIVAPALAVAEGATVQGRIDTGARKTTSTQVPAAPPKAATSAA
jgi:cytoskeletal protein CcmA (bactofilin family)